MILVTGGTGMLGSYIVEELQRRGQAVRVLARPHSADLARQKGVEVSLGDLADVDSLRRAAQGVMGIIHAACTFSQPAVDIAAMEALLATWDQGPFVFISSVSVYGRSRWVPTSEDHPLDDRSAYGIGKIRCEELLAEHARQTRRTDFSILRPPHIWAPDPRCLHHRASPTTELYARIRDGAPVVLPGRTQDQWSGYGDDWIDARELAWAAAQCLVQPLGEAANAINSYFTWHDFCIELIRMTGSSSQLEHKDLDAIAEQELSHKDFFAQNWRYSGQRLGQRLGYRPCYRWQDTLTKAIEMDR